MFYRLSKLTDTNTIGITRRVKILRKWRHLGCRLYHHILDCVKQTLPSRNTTDLLNGRKDKNSIVATEVKARGDSMEDKEAAHVSDSSHVDFLNFMIGYNFDDSKDYQMWFY